MKDEQSGRGYQEACCQGLRPYGSRWWHSMFSTFLPLLPGCDRRRRRDGKLLCVLKSEVFHPNRFDRIQDLKDGINERTELSP